MVSDGISRLGETSSNKKGESLFYFGVFFVVFLSEIF